ncbi:MAG: NAD-binding protein [Gemmatimonadetes bacterium]|nr:NAD-binding protein [Gemmatimonadota bacterium]
MGRRLWKAISAHAWWSYAVLVLAVWTLGLIGFRDLTTPRISWPDSAYRSLQLFFLEFGPERLGSFGEDWRLHVARFAAPLTMALGAVAAIARIYVDRSRQLWARLFYRDHAIVCGSGRKGLRLAREFRDAGTPVVVLEKDGSNGLLEACRASGSVVFVGDAREGDLLRQAGVRKAKHVLVVCGEGGVNAAVAARVREELLESSAGRPVTCFAHIEDPGLCRLLMQETTSAEEVAPFRLEFFNVHDTAARALLDEHPPRPVPGDPAARLLIVGLGALGQSLLTALVRRWALDQDLPSLEISVFDSDVERRFASAIRRLPTSTGIDRSDLHELDRAAPVFDLDAIRAGGSPSVAYVSLDDDSSSLSAAVSLVRRTRGESFPIVVCLSDESGLTTLLERSGEGEFARLRPFAWLARACTREVVLGGINETMARAIHEGYLRQRLESGPGRDPDPSLRSWDELPEALKESNRQQADDIRAKLHSIGCEILPIDVDGRDEFEFRPHELESLAVLEHRRWIEERRRDGWRRGDAKDIDRKVTPFLVPWEELSEEIRERDRHAVREIPTVLHRVGLTIHRHPQRGETHA